MKYENHFFLYMMNISHMFNNSVAKMTSLKAGDPLNRAIVEPSYSALLARAQNRNGPKRSSPSRRECLSYVSHVWETSASACSEESLMLPRRGEQKCGAGVAGEEEGSVGGPTHIVQAAENSCRASLC